jgi:hypothetical protein
MYKKWTRNVYSSFPRWVRKFIAQIQMTFPNCADINLCLHFALHIVLISKPNWTQIHRTSQYIYMSDPNSKSSVKHFVRRLSDRYFKVWRVNGCAVLERFFEDTASNRPFDDFARTVASLVGSNAILLLKSFVYCHTELYLIFWDIS